MKNVILILVFTIALTLTANAQQCTTVETCQTKLSEAAKMINQLLDVSEANDKLVTALKLENESRLKLNQIDNVIIERQKGEIADLVKLNTILKAKTARSFSVFFGLIKLKY